MTRLWTRAEVKELGEIVEELLRASAAVSRLCSSPGRHGMIQGLGFTANRNMTAARLGLEDALRIGEKEDEDDPSPRS